MRRIASTVSLQLAAAQRRNFNEVATRAASSFLSFLPSKSSNSCAANARFFGAKNHHLQLTTYHRHEHTRFLSSTTENNQQHQTTIKQKQVEINGRIVAFGKKKDWANILDMYEKEKEHYNHINYATSMSQLGRIQSFPKDHRLLEEMMIDIATQLQIPTAGSWGAQEMANVLHAVAKIKLKSDASRRLIDSVLGQDNLEILLESGDCQEIANTAWACATLGVECTSLFKAIDDNALYLVRNGTIQAIANTAWACATLAVECPSLFKAIDDNALYFVENGTVQAIANTAWACATLGVNCPSLFNAIDNNALYLVENGTVQAIANTAWACGKLGVECASLFKSIEDNALYLVENGLTQNIANTAWACATLAVECPSLFKAIEDNALYLVDNGNSQEIANTAWACATLGVECPLLFKAIDDKALYLVENGNGQEIANMAWASAKLGVECPLLFKAIDDNALNFVRNGNSQEIANTAWACATLAVECPSLFKAINDNALFLVENANSQEIANTALACATLGVECPLFFKAIGSHIERFVTSCNEQEIANLCYSYAILDLALEHEATFGILWNRATMIQFNDSSRKCSRELFQTFVVVSRVMQLPPPTELLTHLESLYQRGNQKSQSQREMSQLLQEMGVSHEMEASPFPTHEFIVPGFWAIDAACKEHMVAIEFDGPSHFLKHVTTGNWLEGRVEDGATKAKRRFLERLGWRVVNVRYWEWGSAESIDAKKKLLAKKLLALDVV